MRSLIAARLHASRTTRDGPMDARAAGAPRLPAPAAATLLAIGLLAAVLVSITPLAAGLPSSALLAANVRSSDPPAASTSAALSAKTGRTGARAGENAAAADTAKGRIEGQVRILVPAAGARPSGVYPTRRVARPAPRTSEIGNVVVFVKDIAGTGALPTAQATIMQRDEAFVPRVVAITRGSTVDFPNADPFFHNVFSLARGSAFDLGRYPRGETRSRRFTSAGLVKVYCHIHSHMTASILVFDHPYFSIPSGDGRFAIDEVPPGTYQVSAWHERIGESISTVRVDAGRTAQVEFALPVDTP